MLTGKGSARVKRKVNDIEYLTCEEALAKLGVKKQSLYTYVSRGLVKAVRQPAGRRRLYLKADVEKLRTRAGDRARKPVVSQSLRYGEPIVQSWISEIRPDGPRYRGCAALDLVAEARSFEFVADLLWTGLPKTRDVPWPLAPAPADIGTWVDAARRCFASAALTPLLVMLAMRQSEQGTVEDPAAQEAAVSGRALVQAFAGVAGLLAGGAYCPVRHGEFVADRLLRGFGHPGEGLRIDALNAALVLSAEHELAAPTFVARICASTGADLAASVASAVLVQSGPMQAGGVADVERLFAAAIGLDDSAAVPAGYSARDLPCFSHPLYDRDPRAAALIRIAREIAAGAERPLRVFRFVDEIERRHGRYPNIFAALAMLCLAMDLPDGSAAFLHTLGRLAGWVAHAAEQRLTGIMLRPRARYVGTPAA
jgi:citrate synthase